MADVLNEQQSKMCEENETDFSASRRCSSTAR